MIRAAINPPMWLDHEKTRMLREADAMTFDPTTNRVPWGLLTEDERAALRAWPHGWKYYDGDGDWLSTNVWDIGTEDQGVYRGKPAPPEPKRHVLWNVGGCVGPLMDEFYTHRIIITEHPDGTMTAEVEAL